MACLAALVQVLFALGGGLVLLGVWHLLDLHSLQHGACDGCRAMGFLLAVTGLLVVGASAQLSLVWSGMAATLVPDFDSVETAMQLHKVTGTSRWAATLMTVGVLLVLLLRAPHFQSRPMIVGESAPALLVSGQWRLVSQWDRRADERLAELRATATAEAEVWLLKRVSWWGAFTELGTTTRLEFRIEGDGSLSPEDHAALRSLFVQHLQEAAANTGLPPLAGAVRRGRPFLVHASWHGLVMTLVLAAAVSWWNAQSVRWYIIARGVGERAAEARRWRRLLKHRSACARCRYDLRGLDVPVCPECGFRIPAAPPAESSESRS